MTRKVNQIVQVISIARIKLRWFWPTHGDKFLFQPICEFSRRKLLVVCCRYSRWTEGIEVKVKGTASRNLRITCRIVRFFLDLVIRSG